jgi:hypothetical protein
MEQLRDVLFFSDNSAAGFLLHDYAAREMKFSRLYVSNRKMGKKIARRKVRYKA